MWNLHPSERLRHWYNFRQQLNECSIQQALKETTQLWSYAPFIKRYLCINDIKSWPDPWRLLYENVYCDIAKVLGMCYTLHFCNHRPNMEIRIYNSLNSLEQYNLLWIEKGKYVLNYEFNSVVNKEHIPADIKLVKKITLKDLDIIKIE